MKYVLMLENIFNIYQSNIIIRLTESNEKPDILIL